MLLTNYWNYLGVFGKTIPSISDFDISIPSLHWVNEDSWSGNVPTIIYGMYNDSTTAQKMAENYALRYNLGMLLGTGTTAVTASDYKLDSDITSTITDLSCNTTCGVDQDALKMTFVISGTNPSSSNVLTITELGIYKNVYSKLMGNVDTQKLLFIRHILDSPKVVQPNQGFSFAFEWIDS